MSGFLCSAPVSQITEASGPTSLTIGSIAEGQILNRVGDTLIGFPVCATGIIHYRDGVATSFSTITLALAGAISGDIVVVGPGTYAESFTIPAGVTVRGSLGDGQAVISGDNLKGRNKK